MATLPVAPLDVVSSSPEATRRIGERLASVAAPGDVLCLWGDLGAGKTVFAKGFGLGLGIDDTISSPTFVLMGEYAGRLPLFHVDLYRLDSATEALDGGLLDDRQATGVVLIEWPDRLGEGLPDDRLDVRIDSTDDGRRIRLVPRGSGYERYVEVAARAGYPAPATPMTGGAA